MTNDLQMTNRKMRAKVRVSAITPASEGTEVLHFGGVAKNSSYPDDGSDEDNTFAKFSPSLSMQLHLANPNLVGTFEVGQMFYLDFSPVT